MKERIEEFIIKNVDKIGYFNFLHIKDFILFAFGVCIGGIIVCFLAGYFIKSVRQLDQLEKTIMVKFIKDSKPLYFANPKTVGEAVHLMAILIFSPFEKKRRFTARDIKRTRIVINVLILITIILFILSILIMSITVLKDGVHFKPII